MEDRPKIYFLEGHSKYTKTNLASLQTAIGEEANDVENIDILANTKMPEDCDVLVISTLYRRFNRFGKRRNNKIYKKWWRNFIASGSRCNY